MTLLDILTRELKGKRIVSGGPNSCIGATIVWVGLNTYEPMFEVTIQQPNGCIEVVNILGEWDIVVE